MNPQPTYKKFLLPGLIIIALVVIGLLLFLKGGAVDQGAALFTGVTKTSNGGISNLNATAYPGTNRLLCITGSTAPQIKVMTPNGGEAFTAGQRMIVTWSTCNITANIAEINLIPTYSWGGGTGVNLVKDVPNTGSATVTLPSAISFATVNAAYGKHFKIEVVYANNGSVLASDRSDNLFTIIHGLDVGISQLLSSSATLSGNAGTFKTTFEVRNDEPNAITLLKTIGLANTGGFTVAFPNSTSTPYAYSSMNVIVTPNNPSIIQGNSFIIASGQREKFTITGTLDPTVVGAYRMKLLGIQVNNQGTITTVQPGINGPIQTTYLTLQ